MSRRKLNFPFDFPEPPKRPSDPSDLSSHKEWFSSCARLEEKACPHDPAPMRLKLAHTFFVLENAQAICLGEGLDHEEARVPLLGALYHDVGRFAQYRVWATFKDKLSMNHGELGACLLDRARTLANEPGARIIRKAVFHHNAFSVPNTLTSVEERAVRVVRDADKLDILRVIDEHLAKGGPYSPTVILSLPDEPGLRSETIIENAKRRRISSYGDLTSVNDFRLLLCSWVWDMHFSASRRLFAQSPHVRRLLDAIPDEGYAEAKDEVRKTLLELAAG